MMKKIFVYLYLHYSSYNRILAFVPESDKTNSSILRVHIIDVEGDAILIELGNQYMLIDAGEKECQTCNNYLEETGVNELDYVIHPSP